MKTQSVVIALLNTIIIVSAINLEYLDPTKLQTRISAQSQQAAASDLITKYISNAIVEVNPLLFIENKDTFYLKTSNGSLYIRASTGVAAAWGLNYYLKKYCSSHIGWQQSNINIPSPLPEVDEYVIANDRFRYYENVCTASYSHVWWSTDEWKKHVEWMALNGINLVLAPVAQEAAWTRVYKRLGLSEDGIDQYFTGPAFLSWLRMGNVHGWGGPLPKSWHDRQLQIQNDVIDYMYQLGIVPVLPAFNGHVPEELSRVFTNASFHNVESWNGFKHDYCCGLFLDPSDPLFMDIGKMFLQEITSGIGTSHIFTADPFNEVSIKPWSTVLVKRTASAIFSTISTFDKDAVWLLQNWMFVHDPIKWPMRRVQSFITSVPNGRMLILDLQSEQWPQYFLYDMYYGQPFIWCMLHNFGGTLGMFGNMRTINEDVYKARISLNSTMIGIGLTPEGINQNYVVYDLMLESAWRKAPVKNLNVWVENYAKRRYGCNSTGGAWRYLLKSVYDFHGLNRMRGKYVITRRPSFSIRPWAWYKSHDLFEAWRRFVFVNKDQCSNTAFEHDLVDVTRQALQYRAAQIYINLVSDRFDSTLVFNATINMFLDVMSDIQSILNTHSDFKIANWLTSARSLATSDQESYLYEYNARNQITLWGPNGEISDYACKQWAELFKYYYTPRWRMFLAAALEAKEKNEYFDEKDAQKLVRITVETDFAFIDIDTELVGDPRAVALQLYEKWANVGGLDDLPIVVIKPRRTLTTLPDVRIDDEDYSTQEFEPTVVMLPSTVMEMT